MNVVILILSFHHFGVHAVIIVVITTPFIFVAEDGPIYESIAAIVSLGDTVIMDFKPIKHDGNNYNDKNSNIVKLVDQSYDTVIHDTKNCDLSSFSVLLEPNSLLIFCGELYSLYSHGIRNRKEHNNVSKVLNWKLIDITNINYNAEDDDYGHNDDESNDVHYRTERRISFTCRRVKDEFVSKMSAQKLIRL